MLVMSRWQTFVPSVCVRADGLSRTGCALGTLLFPACPLSDSYDCPTTILYLLALVTSLEDILRTKTF